MDLQQIQNLKANRKERREEKREREKRREREKLRSGRRSTGLKSKERERRGRRRGRERVEKLSAFNGGHGYACTGDDKDHGKVITSTRSYSFHGTSLR